MAQYDGSLKFDTKLNTSGFAKGLKGLKNAAGKAFGAIKKSVTVVSGVVAGATAGIVGMVEATKELNGDLGKFNANVEASGKSTAKMNDQLARFNGITGELDSSIEGISNLLAIGLNDTELDQVFDNLAGAIVKFPDTLKFESLSDSLQETLATGKGVGQFGELLERSGINLDQFNEDLAKATTQADKNRVAIDYLNKTGLAPLAKNYEEANKEQLDYSKNQFLLQQQMGELAAEFVPILNSVFPLLIELLRKVKDKVSILIEPIKKVLDTFVNMVHGVEGAGKDLIKSIGDIFKKVKAKVQEVVPQIVEEIKSMITKAADFMRSEEGKTALGEAIKTMFSDALALLKELPDLIAKIGDFIGSVVDAFFEDKNFDALGQGIVNLFDEVITSIIPSLVLAGGRIALNIIDGIVHQLKRGKDKVQSALESIGIGSTSEQGLGSYGGNISGSGAFGGATAGTPLPSNPNFSQGLHDALAGQSLLEQQQNQVFGPVRPNGNTVINISGKEVLSPIDTAREVDKVINHGLAGGVIYG